MSPRRHLVALAAAGLLSGAAALPAHAAGPDLTTETVDFTIPEHGMYTGACGFPVSLHVWGSFTVLTWTDDAGNTTKEFRNYRFRSETSANGKTIQGRSMGPETTVVNADGSSTVHVRGVVHRVVPGSGTVRLSWGSGVTIWPAGEGDEVVVDPTGGPEDLQPICDYLAP